MRASTGYEQHPGERGLRARLPRFSKRPKQWPGGTVCAEGRQPATHTEEVAEVPDYRQEAS